MELQQTYEERRLRVVAAGCSQPWLLKLQRYLVLAEVRSLYLYIVVCMENNSISSVLMISKGYALIVLDHSIKTIDLITLPHL